jgi:hypothetical protein
VSESAPARSSRAPSSAISTRLEKDEVVLIESIDLSGRTGVRPHRGDPRSRSDPDPSSAPERADAASSLIRGYERQMALQAEIEMSR